MTELFAGLIVLFLIFFYLGMGVWVFVGLILVSLTVQFFVLDMSLIRIGSIASGIMLRSSSSWELAAIPMFILGIHDQLTLALACMQSLKC
ncbi:MAG: hypothetical protein MI743_00745 [Sneathiellales bacterium]|nr:hypothetical protein [Sneathiellales bacterium]